MKDGTHWRERAQGGADHGRDMRSLRRKRMMLDIARRYDLLAERAKKPFAENEPTLVKV